MLEPHIKEAIHELADVVVNPTGYADDPVEADLRAGKRDALEAAITVLVVSTLLSQSEEILA